VIDEWGHSFSAKTWQDGAWELAYLSLMAAGIAASVALLVRRAMASSVAAALFGVSLLFLVFGDPFSYTRASAPMFATLLVGGLEQRSRPALTVCVVATAMTAIMPFVPWFRAA
jgi:hypothetical protein